MPDTLDVADIDLADLPRSVPTVDELIVTRKLVDQARNPNLRYVDSIVLRDNSKTVIVADHVEVLNQNTGEIRHGYVKLSASGKFRKSEGGGYVLPATKEIIINDDGRDEIIDLRNFINVVKSKNLPEQEGRYLIIPLDGEEDDETIARIKDALGDSDKIQLALGVLEQVGNDAELIGQLAQYAQANPDSISIASASLKLGQYIGAIDRLRELVEENPTEPNFQSHLERHPWMFGSDYSELLDQRDYVQGQITDFPLRRTADGYLEIIEIKRPITDSLFILDPSHDSWYPRSDLTKAVAQIMGYIEILDAERDRILIRHGVDTHKVRAKIVIGRDGDQHQAEALRRYNSHINRIEILTFDQLCRTADRVVSQLKEVVEAANVDGV